MLKKVTKNDLFRILFIILDVLFKKKTFRDIIVF